jgi:hypothetical protein
MIGPNRAGGGKKPYTASVTPLNGLWLLPRGPLIAIREQAARVNSSRLDSSWSSSVNTPVFQPKRINYPSRTVRYQVNRRFASPAIHDEIRIYVDRNDTTTSSAHSVTTENATEVKKPAVLGRVTPLPVKK